MHVSCLAPLLLALASLTAQQPAVPTRPAEPAAPDAAPKRAADADGIAALLATLGEDVQVFNDHVVTLANPFMEGRLPGTRGMETAMQYMEYWFTQAGVQPAFPDAKGTTPWRQPFPLGSKNLVQGQTLSVAGATLDLRPGVDFLGTLLGGNGEATAPVVFAGYGIERGPDDFSSFGEGADLEGKIALIFRFEPMNDTGASKWAAEGEPWTSRANNENKLRGLARRKVKGVLIVNPPDCKDPRARELVAPMGQASRPFPVLQVSTSAGERLLAALAPTRTLAELRQLADAGGKVLEFAKEMTVGTKITKESLVAENVGALLPGKGELASQYIVIGAHLDHLGMGEFGSRSGPGKLHPGADDNATGAAALLMLAEKLKRTYATLDRPARTLLFMAFSAEESGLVGARHYVANPLVELPRHTLMINFDMIGRIRNKRLSVQGVNTAKGLDQLLQPIFAQSPLELVMPKQVMPASDHWEFLQKRVPVLFSIIADFHNDYHTPADVSAKINREDAVHTIRLYEQITMAVATHPAALEFKSGRD